MSLTPHWVIFIYPAVLRPCPAADGHGQLDACVPTPTWKIRSRSDRGGGFPPGILEGFVDFAFRGFDSGLQLRQQGLRHLPDCA